MNENNGNPFGDNGLSSSTPVSPENNANTFGTPVTPVTPAEPVQASTPVTPVAPAEPAQASTPVTPVAPAQPVGFNQETTTYNPTMAQQTAAPEPVKVVDGPKNSKVGLIVALVIVALIVVGGVAGYFIYTGIATKPKNIVNSTIDSLFSNFTTEYDKMGKVADFDLNKQTVELSGKVSGSLEVKADGIDETYVNLFKELSDYSFDFDTVLNLKDRQMSLDLNLNNKDSAFLGVDAFFKDKKIYFKADGITDKPYYYELSDDEWKTIDEYLNDLSDSLDSVDEENLTNVINNLNGYIQDAVKEEYLSQENGEFTVDGTTFKGYRTYMTLDAKVGHEIAISVLTSLKSDAEFKKLVDSFNEYLEDDEKIDVSEELSDAIEDLQDEMKDFDDDDLATKLELNLYTNNFGKLLGMKLVYKEDGEDDYTAVTYLSDLVGDKKEVLKVYDTDEKALLTLTTENDTTTGKVAIDDDNSFDFTIKETDNSYEFSCKYGDMISANMKLTIDSKDKDVKETLTADAKYSEDDIAISGSINVETETKEVSEIKTFDTKDAVAIAEMTEDSYNTMLTNLESKIKGTIIEDIITIGQNVTNSMITDDDYTYDYSDYEDYSWSDDTEDDEF